MLNTLSTPELGSLLDDFCVPMFAIECRAQGRDPRILLANAALVELTGTARDALIGMPIARIAGAAEEALHLYRHCITSRERVRFPFVFVHNQTRMCWDKTLQYAGSPDGHDRVVATAFHMPQIHPMLEDKLAFEDLRFFSSVADLQIGKLQNAFELAAVTAKEEERLLRLQGVCRQIQRSVADIKRVVREAEMRHGVRHDPSTSDLPTQAGAIPQMSKVGTLNVLSETCLNPGA